MTKDEIIDALFTVLDNLSFQGCILDDEEEYITELYEAYIKIKGEEKNV